MKVTRYLALAMSTALVGSALGCAPAIPNAKTPDAIPMAQSLMEGSVHPDQLITDDRMVMVDGKTMSFEQIRQQLPARISEADAARLLVSIDPSKVMDSGEMELQQRRGWRGGGRSFARGWGRGFARGFGRGLYRGFGNYRYFGYRGYYFPYYYNAGYYYPYTYPYGGLTYAPYLYGYGGGLYPYSYCW